MALSDEIKTLITEPREALVVEVKDWLSPSTPKHKAKLVKAIFALRNRGGGYLLIGFDKTMQPSPCPTSLNPITAYNADAMQALVSKYASESFEVPVEFPEREGVRYPVLVIPGGVKTPVAVKADLQDEDNDKTFLLRTNEVYVRSLNANNIASSTLVRWNDWPSIVQTCFDNRETDIGNFLRRHLNTGERDKLRGALTNIDEISTPAGVPNAVVSHKSQTQAFLTESNTRREQVIKERQAIPPHGYWEVAMAINGEFPEERLNKRFLRTLDANNPRYTGWPVWMNTEQFRDSTAHPYVFEKLYEAFVVVVSDGFGGSHIDFMRLDPVGRFYLSRAYEDDLAMPARAIKPFTVLDFSLPILRAGESIAVGLDFARGLGCDPEKTSVSFLFGWHNLGGRTLSSWANPNRMIWSGRSADRQDAGSYVEVPLDLPISRLGSITKEATSPLYDAFDTEIADDVLTDLTTRLVTRTLNR